MLSSDFINSLPEEEMALLLYFVNVVNRPLSHEFPFEINDLKWFRKDILTQKLLDSFDKLTIDGHLVFVSLLEKFGVKVEIKKEIPTPVTLPTTSSVEPIVSQSIQPEITQSVEK